MANYQKRHDRPDESAWAELRDAQPNTLRVPNTAEAILIDLGEEGDIHSRNKRDVGERLARIALAKDYRQANTVWSGPVLDTMKVEPDGAVRLRFTHADGGLRATPIVTDYRPRSYETETKSNVRNSPGGSLEGFAVCGADHQWHWAMAVDPDGADGVVVRCAQVPAPVAVRYAWGNNPLCNLANGAGLPAGPFRTDDFPLSTARASTDGYLPVPSSVRRGTVGIRGQGLSPLGLGAGMSGRHSVGHGTRHAERGGAVTEAFQFVAPEDAPGLHV